MKIPNEIKTLTELLKWVEKNKPKVIVLGKKSRLRNFVDVRDYKEREWLQSFYKRFGNDIQLKYEN